MRGCFRKAGLPWIRAALKGHKLRDDNTPEDVATLYHWAKLTGAKYRDYSAERREKRARFRYQPAKRQLDQGVKSQTKPPTEESQERRVPMEDFLGERKNPDEQPEVVVGLERVSDLISQVQIPSDVEEPAVEAQTAIRPAWLGPSADFLWSKEAMPADISSPRSVQHAVRRLFAAETLMDSREQVALRWPALQALAAELRSNVASARISRQRGPVTAILPVVGGAGGTSLAATLARALSKNGERVLLVQTTAESLLPFYFGMGRLQPGELHPVPGQGGGTGSLFIISLEYASFGASETGQTQVKRMREGAFEDLLSKVHGCNRVLIDLAPETEWIVSKIAASRPMVLAAITPQMGSVAGLLAMDQRFAAVRDSEGRALLPFYVLNQFDAGLPLHLDIREVLRCELDERLLATAIRRSAAVGEALAQGATVLDYAPDAPAARDYADVARWLQEAAPASVEAIAATARGEQ